VLRFSNYRTHYHIYNTKVIRRHCNDINNNNIGDTSNTDKEKLNHHSASLHQNEFLTLHDEENDINDMSDTIIDDELVNIDLLGENENDQQLLVIHKMINEDLQRDKTVLSPVEIFQSLYKDLKQRKKQNSSSDSVDNNDGPTRSPVLSSEEMLSRIYTDAQRPDPFDDVSYDNTIVSS